MSETDTIIEAPGRSDVELLHLDPQPVMSIRETIKVADLAEMMGKWIPELLTCMQQEGAQPAGPLFVRYHTFGESETDMETGVPVAVHLPGDGRTEPGVLPGGPAASTWHVHKPHRALGEAYARLGTWCEQQGREADGPAWEVYYWIDPRDGPDIDIEGDLATWRTQLVQPVR